MIKKVDFLENPHHHPKRYIIKSIFLITFFHWYFNCRGWGSVALLQSSSHFETSALEKLVLLLVFYLLIVVRFTQRSLAWSIYFCKCVFSLLCWLSHWVCPVNEFQCVKVGWWREGLLFILCYFLVGQMVLPVLEECCGTPCGFCVT
jgi:hypothetical protein